MSSRQQAEQRLVENPHAGWSIVFTATAADTGGEYVEFEVTIQPGGAPIPLHVHPRQIERGRVLEGELTLKADGRTTTVHAGENILLPAGIPHAMVNAGPVPLRAVSRVEPALHFEELLRAIVLRAAHVGRRYPSLWELAAILQRHPGELYAGGLPLALQRLVLPPLAALGRLFGGGASPAEPVA